MPRTKNDTSAPADWKTDLTAYKARVRATAQRIGNDGYWSTEQMNKVLVRLGVEPYSKFVAVVTATGTNESPRDLGSGTREGAQQEVDRIKDRAADYVSSYNWKADPDSVTVELRDLAEAIDAEADPDASTEDIAVYRKLVRRIALAEARARDWCESGVNRYLEHLGLPLKGQVYVPVTVTVQQIHRVKFDEAEDYADALRLIEEGKAGDAVKRALGSGINVEDVKPLDLEAVKPRDPDPCNSYGDHSRQCRVRDEKGAGYYCTRDKGHPVGTQHIAGDGSRVLAVWPNEAEVTAKA